MEAAFLVGFGVLSVAEESDGVLGKATALAMGRPKVFRTVRRKKTGHRVLGRVWKRASGMNERVMMRARVRQRHTYNVYV